MNNLARKNIRRPLVWVKPEIDITIDAIHTLIKTYTDTLDNDKALTEINGHLHLLRGSLEMLELHAIVLLIESMQTAVDALLAKTVNKKEDVFEALLQATLALKAYIDKLHSDQNEMPLSLLPVMNDIRASIGEPLLSESALFLPNLSIVPKTPDDIPKEYKDTSLTDSAKSLRPYYQAALLTWFRDPTDKLSLQQMKLVAKNLESSSLTPRNRQIWWILGGLFEAISDKGLKPTISIKKLIAQADRILKSLAHEDSTLFEKSPPIDLLKNALYYISQSSSNGERIKMLKEVYNLNEVIPNDQDVSAYRNDLNSPSSDSLQAISAELKKSLDQVKSTIDAFSRNSENYIEELTPTITPLKHIADTMSLLNLGSEKKSVQTLIKKMNSIISHNNPPEKEVMLDIASSMLHIENALLAIGSSNQQNSADSDQSSNEKFDSGGEMMSTNTGTIPEAEYRLLVIKTAEEAKNNIIEVKNNVLSYLSSADRQSTLIQDIPALLQEIKGSMIMLQNRYLPNILNSLLQYVTNDFIPNKKQNSNTYDAFAEAIVSIEYYLESITEDRSPSTPILDVTCENLGKLGYPTVLPKSTATDVVDSESVVTHINEAPPRQKTNLVIEAQDKINEPTSESNILSFSTEEPDPEVKEIFIDEAFEELSNMYLHITALKLNPNDEDTLLSLRKIYHTMKGSGKIAGAIEMSNVATATDDFIAKVLCKSITIDEKSVSLISDAHQLLYLVIERFQNNISAKNEVEQYIQRLSKLVNQKTSEMASDKKVEANVDHELNNNAIKQLHIIEAFIKTQSQSISNAPINQETNNAIKQLTDSAKKTENQEFIQTTRLLSKHINNVSKMSTPISQETLEILDEFCVTAREIFIDISFQDSKIPVLDQAQNSNYLESDALDDLVIEEKNTPEQDVKVDSKIVMEPSDEGDIDLIEIFTEEALELIEKGHKIVSDAPAEDDKFLAAVQRLLHTMKGSARMAGVTSVGSLAHTLESVFESAISKSISTPKNISSLTQETFDAISDMIEDIRAGVSIRNHDDLISRLSKACSPQINLAEPISVTKTDSTKSVKPKNTQSQKDQTKEIQAKNKSSVVTLTPPVITDKIISRNEGATTKQAKPVITSTPTDDITQLTSPAIAIVPPTKTTQVNAGSDTSAIKSEPIKVEASILDKMVDFAIEENAISNRIGEHVTTCKSNLIELDKAISRTLTQMRDLQFESNIKRSDAKNESSDDLNLNSFSESQKVAQRLMESIGDIENLHSALTRLTLETDNLVHQQKKIHGQLYENLLNTRMVTFSIQTQRMQRIVRQTCNELHKKAKLVLEGTDGSIDRSILDTIMGPLEHIIRNAIAHGIEFSGDRRENKKHDTGTIKISFSKDKSEHLIIISDDGAGLNLDDIQQKAIEKGIIEKNKTYSVEEIINLIFEPGFSTSTEVSQISGRGVGMDVVLNTINDLGGSISVATELEKGSTFTIRLPFTLSRNHTLIINSGNNTYALPSSCIEQSFPVSQAELLELYKPEIPIFQFGNHHYPLWYIDTLLNDSPTSLPSTTGQSIIILVKFGKKRIALHVDGIEDTRDTVLKPNSPQLSNVGGIAGATVMGDGKVVLIIDIPSLTDLSENATGKARQFQEIDEDSKSDKEIVTLIVDDSITVRKVTERFLKRNGIISLAAKDGLEALELLEHEMPDIMLVDIEMPNMDGLELATRIKADKRLQHIPIVMITSRTGKQHRSAATKIGVDVFLGKPYQEAELIGYIQALTGKRVKH